MTDFFAADHHFFHKNVIAYDSRPWSSMKDMNEGIIESHNAWVGPEDTTFFLGDIAMLGRNGIPKLAPILERMNGYKHLILGNHDEGLPFTYVNNGFNSVHTALKYTEQVCLVHDPACTAVDRDSVIWFVGHIHDLFKVYRNCINVGVMQWNYVPQTFRSLIKHFFSFHYLTTSGIKDVLRSFLPDAEEIGVEFNGKQFWYEYNTDDLSEFKKEREFVPVEEIIGNDFSFSKYVKNFCYVREV